MRASSLAPFREWQVEVANDHPELLGPLWKLAVYRLALYAIDGGWFDVASLERRGPVQYIGPQLYRALGSTGANIAEGYSRSSGKDRVRMLEYALGSARESQVWYYASRHVLPSEAFAHRQVTLVQICRLLSTMIPAERGRVIRKTVS